MSQIRKQVLFYGCSLCSPVAAVKKLLRRTKAYVPGQSAACACEDGNAGAQQCLEDDLDIGVSAAIRTTPRRKKTSHL